MTRDTNKSSTVLKAFRVLEAVAAGADSMTAGEVAKQAGVERVTAYRMLRTIQEAGYLEFDPSTKTYRISKRMLSLARPVLEDIDQRESIAELLKAVALRTGETCHYSELDGVETVLTQRAKGNQLVAVDFKIGTRCELHATSVGKAILAFQTEQFIDDYVSLDLKRYTDRTLVDAARLRDELGRIRKAGAAFDFEELAEGMNCVAVPVHGLVGTQGGVSISGPIHRLTERRLSELADVIQEEVARIR